MQPQVAIDYALQRRHELDVQAEEELYKEDLGYFALNAGIRLDGMPFSFQYHEYLIEPYEMIRKANEVIFEKAAQMGLSTLELLDTYHGARYGTYPHGVLYLLPSKTDVTEFSKSKAQSLIDENLLIKSWLADTDTANVKKIGTAWLFFRGMVSKIGLKTITVDKIVFDEIEEIEDWSLVALAEERMSHVEEEKKFVHRLSVPSIPSYGIDGYFAGNDDAGIRPSDQRYLHFRCEACNEWTCFEDEWPDCIVEVDAKRQKAIRICKKCKRELPLSSKLNWVPKNLESSILGYHFSQLFSRYINPWKLLDQFQKKRDLTTLYNDKLGIPYVEAEARLELQDIYALCTSNMQLNAFPGPAAMGVDQPKAEGGKFHVTIGYKSAAKACNVIRVCIRNTWTELADLMDSFSISRCVVDALPDQAKAREFAKTFSGKVFLCYYAEKQKGAAKWNEHDWIVSVDRTESLNDSTRAIHEQRVSIPRRDDEDIKLLARHMHNIARKKEEDKDSGSVRQTWVKTGADHYRHAFNYLYLALKDIGEYIPPKPNDWLGRLHRRRNWKVL